MNKHNLICLLRFLSYKAKLKKEREYICIMCNEFLFLDTLNEFHLWFGVNFSLNRRSKQAAVLRNNKKFIIIDEFLGSA